MNIFIGLFRVSDDDDDSGTRCMGASRKKNK